MSFHIKSCSPLSVILEDYYAQRFLIVLTFPWSGDVQRVSIMLLARPVRFRVSHHEVNNRRKHWVRGLEGTLQGAAIGCQE